MTIQLKLKFAATLFIKAGKAMFLITLVIYACILLEVAATLMFFLDFQGESVPIMHIASFGITTENAD